MHQRNINDMKIIYRTILWAASVLFAAVSCQKDMESAEPSEEGKGTIEVSVSGLMGEYTQVDATRSELVNTVRVSWKGGETVYVYDGTQCLGSLVASLEGDEDRYALLSTDGDGNTIKKPSAGTKKLTLVHSPLLTEAPAVRNGVISVSLADQNGAKAPFVAYATLDYDNEETITNAVVPFKFATSVIKVNCTGLKANTAITSAELMYANTVCGLSLSGTSAPTVTGGVFGSIVRTNDSGFASGKVNDEGEAVFQIAVPVLGSTGLRTLLMKQGDTRLFYDWNFSKKELKESLSTNTVCQMYRLPSDAIPGLFSVSSDRQVIFSKGNLTYNVSSDSWAFYGHQYDSATGYDSKLISLFTWGYGSSWSKSPDSTGFLTGNTFRDWGEKVADGKTWHTLSTEQWQYLFNYNNTATGKDYRNSKRDGRYKFSVKVCGKGNCIVLLPDVWNESVISLADFAKTKEYSESTSVKWSDMEKAGAVCLPSTGYRYGNTVRNAADGGTYWSSTSYTNDSNYAFYLDTDIETTPETVCPYYCEAKFLGFAVRLVSDYK